MKKVLVTGGAGYIGSHTVVSLVEAGYTPIIVDDFRNSEEWIVNRVNELTNTLVTVYNCDCNDKVALKSVFEQEKDISSVIHFVADKAVGESVQNPLKYYHNNIGSLVTLLELMKEFEIDDLVFSSSCTVYGEPDKMPVSEETPIQKATSPYGNTKIICEQIIQDQKAAHPNLNAVLLRYFNPIGAHPSAKIGELPQGIPNNLVPYLTQTAAGEREILTVFGNDYDTADGTCLRDYIHVCDLAEAHVKSLDYMTNNSNDDVHIFNVGTGDGVSVLEIINTFESSTGLKLNWKFGPRRAGDVVQIYAEAEKVNKDLNWKHRYSVKDALEHSWAWEKSIRESE